MKRNLIGKIIGAVLLASLFFISQDCWPQINPSSSSKPFCPPFRTYCLQLSPEKLWVIVINTVSELEYEIYSEDASVLFLVAIGKPYYVQVGLGKKKERRQITIELQQKRKGIYDCYIKIEIQDFWPVNNQWTKKSGEIDVTDTLIPLGNLLSKKLSHYSK